MRSIFKTTDYAGQRVKYAASSARGSVIDLGTQVLRLVNNVRESDLWRTDGLLGRVGLSRRGSPLRPVLWFAAGAVVGGAGLLLAPAIGRGLREGTSRLRGALQRGQTGKEKMATGVHSVRQAENGGS